MIPIRLEMKNFMSYGDQVMPLDFRGMRLACLSGDNGHGKSAILDAITWSLWGEARASADELIRLGCDEMRVTLDFEVGGDVYRVLRARSKRASGNLWELYIQEPGGDFRSLTGQGIKDTRDVVRRVLRMDYKTFVNSAYIQQGKADEFTRQTVGDRKKILGEILDLSRYDALEVKAKTKRIEAEQLAQELELLIAQSEAELGLEEGFRSELAQAESERSALAGSIAEAEERRQFLHSRRLHLQSAAARVLELRSQTGRLKSEIENLKAQKGQQELQLARTRELLAERDRIESGIARLREVRSLITGLEKRLEELRALEHRRGQAQQAILVEKHRLELQYGSFAKEVSELQTKISESASIEKDLADLTARVAGLDELDAQRGVLQKQYTEYADTLGEMKAQNEQMLQLSGDLEGKLALIRQPDSQCPLCGTDLGSGKLSVLVSGYEDQIADVAEKLQALKRRGIEVKTLREKTQSEVTALESLIRNGREVRAHLGMARQMLLSLDAYREQLPEVRDRANALKARIDAGDFEAEERTRLSDIERSIAALEYNGAAHAELKSEIARLEPFEGLSVRLQHAQENLQSEENGVRNVSDLISVREQSVEECLKGIEEMSGAVTELESAAAEEDSAVQALAALRSSEHEAVGRIARLQQSLQRCELLREDSVEKRKMREKARVDAAAYKDLTAAFGRKGVQALIIENAVPELRDEANRLLSRMTDNAMQIAIDTVKDKKTGGMMETLDIRISDDMGTRAYELYSGGEAFRANFALRIALSRLLARRAGASLQTLIIDEGFGTQDAKGREKLVEAIDSIKDDFECILVITHIDELKDAFPTRIEITKDESGSHISVE